MMRLTTFSLTLTGRDGSSEAAPRALWGSPPPDPIVSDPNAQPVTDATPHVRRIRMADIVVTNAKSAAACLYGLPEAPLEDISIVNTQIHLVEDTPSFPVMNAVQQPVTLAGLMTDLRIVGAREDEITLRDVE